MIPNNYKLTWKKCRQKAEKKMPISSSIIYKDLYFTSIFNYIFFLQMVALLILKLAYLMYIEILPEHLSSKCVAKSDIFTKEGMLFWNFALNVIALISSSNRHSQDDQGVVCNSRFSRMQLRWTKRYLNSQI